MSSDEPNEDTPPQPAKSRFSMPKMPSMPKLPNLTGSGNPSLHDCMMPPTILQRVPDMDANTAQFYETTKQKLDVIVIKPYIDLGDNIPHILADGFQQFFKENKHYEEMVCKNIGDSVQRSMGYVIRSNGSKFEKSLIQKGGTTCDGNPPFDWRSLIPGMPNWSYPLKKSEEEKTEEKPDEKQLQEQIKTVGQAIAEFILPRFSKNNGATYSEINAYIERLLDYIYRQYNKTNPRTNIIRKIVDSEIHGFLADTINKFIASVNQSGGAEEAPVEEAPAKKPGFFSRVGNTLKKKANEKMESASQGLTSLKAKAASKLKNASNAAMEFKRNPLTSIKNFSKNTFIPKNVRECGTKNEEILPYKPDTYDMQKISSESDKYVGQNINAILCQHKETLKPLCVDIVLHHLSEYLKDVSPGTPLFESTKKAYIECIGVFCEQLPEDIAFKMIHKYLFETDVSNFLEILSSQNFKVENIMEKYDPFANIEFKFESNKTVTALAGEPNIRKPLADSTELRYTFAPIEFNKSKENVISQATSTVGKMLLGNSVQLSYGDTRALPRLVFKYLVENVDIAIKNTETLNKICKLFDEAVYRSVDAINNQLKTDTNLTIIMCKYLISRRSITKGVIESSIKAYNDLFSIIENSKISPDSLNNMMKNMMGFFIYHAFYHKLNPNSKTTDIYTIFEEYAKKMNFEIKRWNNHPLETIFKKKGELHKVLMDIVGKPYTQLFISEHKLGGNPRKYTKRFRKNKKRKSRKYKGRPIRR